MLAHLKSTACLVGVALCCQSAAVADDIKPFDTVQGWGWVVDPVGDCGFRLAEGVLTITVPGAYHDLWPVKGQVNAPLVLQDATGDFTVEVKVAHVDQAEQGTVIPGLASSVSFHAGTLVIWKDSRNFVRLDRTDMNNRGRAITSCYLHVFKDGERVVELAPVVPDKPTHLRLGRHGDRLSAAYSQDGGKTWRSLPPQRARLPEKVKVGVSALNSTTRPCEVRFENFKVTK